MFLAYWLLGWGKLLKLDDVNEKNILRKIFEEEIMSQNGNTALAIVYKEQRSTKTNDASKRSHIHKSKDL